MPPFSGTWFGLNELNSRVYNLAEFQKLAEKIKDDSSLTSEEKETIEKFLVILRAENEKTA